MKHKMIPAVLGVSLMMTAVTGCSSSKEKETEPQTMELLDMEIMTEAETYTETPLEIGSEASQSEQEPETLEMDISQETSTEINNGSSFEESEIMESEAGTTDSLSEDSDASTDQMKPQPSKESSEPETETASEKLLETEAGTTVKGNSASSSFAHKNISLAVAADRVNVRAEASVDSEALALLTPGLKVISLWENGEWTCIKFESEEGISQGYIKSEFLKPADQLYQAKEKVNLRAKPDSGSEKLGSLEAEDQVVVLEKQGDWFLTASLSEEAKVITAYVKAEFLEKAELDPSENIIKEYQKLLGETTDSDTGIEKETEATETGDAETESESENKASETEIQTEAKPAETELQTETPDTKKETEDVKTEPITSPDTTVQTENEETSSETSDTEQVTEKETADEEETQADSKTESVTEEETQTDSETESVTEEDTSAEENTEANSETISETEENTADETESEDTSPIGQDGTRWSLQLLEAQISLAQELLPELTSVGVICSEENTEVKTIITDTAEYASSLGISILEMTLIDETDIDLVAAELVGKTDAILLADDVMVNGLTQTITAYADEVGIPVIGFEKEQIPQGCTAAISGKETYFSRSELEKLGITFEDNTGRNYYE